MAFDKKTYDNEYQKKYKQFKARITQETWEELSKLLQENSLSHAEFILQAMEDLKKKSPKIRTRLNSFVLFLTFLRKFKLFS